MKLNDLGDVLQMKKMLLDVVFMSEKRKQVLLLLQEGPKGMEEILKFLDTNRQALLPQVRILEEHYLINHYRDIYDLTTLGKLIVNEISSFLEYINIFDEDVDYWGAHDFGFIPPHLFNRINELGECKVINPPLMDIYEMNNDFYEASKKSKSLCGITTLFYPKFPELFSELISKNVNVHFIISKNLHDKIRTDNYADFERLINSKLFQFSLYTKNMDFLSFSYNDYYTKIRPKKSNGEFESKYLLCRRKDSFDWGKELFEYYLKDSVSIVEI